MRRRRKRGEEVEEERSIERRSRMGGDGRGGRKGMEEEDGHTLPSVPLLLLLKS